MELTKDNYYTLENQYISNSKVSDFIKGKDYFYKKDVTGEIPRVTTKSMVTGSAVDELLTDINNIKQGRYAIREFNGTTKDGREETKRLTEEGKIILTQAAYDEIMGLSLAVSETSAYKELQTHNSQQILKVDISLGQFPGICGIPDWFKIDEKNRICIITDLKTAQTVNYNRYFYHCKEFGYFRQQAFYQMLLTILYPDIETFISRHLVVGKEKNIYPVKTFILDQKEIEREKLRLGQILSDISETTDWNREDVTWEDADTLTDPAVAEWCE